MNKDETVIWVENRFHGRAIKRRVFGIGSGGIKQKILLELRNGKYMIYYEDQGVEIYTPPISYEKAISVYRKIKNRATANRVLDKIPGTTGGIEETPRPIVLRAKDLGY